MKHRESGGKQIRTCQFTVPEVKIAFVLVYWATYLALFYTAISISDGRVDVFNSLLRSYTDCEAGGSRKSHDCHMLRLDLEAEANPALEIIFFIVVAIGNFSSLPFVIDFDMLKKFVIQVANKFSSKSTSTVNQL